MKKRFPALRVNPALPPAEYDRATIAKVKGRCRMLENGCWEFLGNRNQQGYGFTSYRGQSWPAHRLMLTLAKGPIPPKHKACHTCDFPPCCNPDHLFSATQKANGEDMAAKRRSAKHQNTACPRGHVYAENARIDPKTGWRQCRVCQRAKCRMDTGWPEDLAFSAPKRQGHAPKDMKRVARRPRRDRMICASGHRIEGDNAARKTNGGVQCRICYNASAFRNRAAKGLAVAKTTSGNPLLDGGK